MTPAHMLLALGMLLSGTLNTLTTNLADNQVSRGTWEVATIWAKIEGVEPSLDHKFDHPYFQALGMFVGEFLCILTYFITRKKAAQDPNIEVPGGRTKGSQWFAIPALLDIVGTGTMYAGLCMSYASVFQMLRGSVVVFTCGLSSVWLKRRVYPFQWFSVLLIVVGIVIVGYVSVMHPKAGGNKEGGKDQVSVLIGDILIVLAQVATAFQMCIEEKLMNKYPHPALKVVGLEGTFGFVMLSVLLIPMYYIRFGDEGYPFENTPDAVSQVGHNGVIVLAIVGNALSIAFFNFFGISVTQQLSAAHRMVLDSVRTLLVWIASILFFGEPFLPGQLVGFFVLSVGTAMYNEIIRVPQLFQYPAHDSEGLHERPRVDSAGSQASILSSLVKQESSNVSTSFIRT